MDIDKKEERLTEVLFVKFTPIIVQLWAADTMARVEYFQKGGLQLNELHSVPWKIFSTNKTSVNLPCFLPSFLPSFLTFCTHIFPSFFPFSPPSFYSCMHLVFA